MDGEDTEVKPEFLTTKNHRVLISAVPAGLCVNPNQLREILSAFGQIEDIQIYNDSVDNHLNGFCFVSCTSKNEAERIVKHLSTQPLHKDMMVKARVALNRGSCVINAVDPAVKQILSQDFSRSQKGRHSIHRRRSVHGNSQNLESSEEDEELLQSMSQFSQMSNQSATKKKKRKKRRID